MQRGATALMWALLSDSGLEMAKLLVHYYSNWLNDIDSTVNNMLINLDIYCRPNKFCNPRMDRRH